MHVKFFCMYARIHTVYICLCECVCLGDRKAESDSEWRTNPFGRTAESNTKYQNLIISIIIFIIFIHFLPAMLNAVCSSLSLSSLSHCSFLCTLIYFFFSSLHCSLHWRHVNLPVMLIDSTQVAYGKAAHFFPFFWSDVVLVMPGPYQETQFIAVSLGKRGCHSRWLTALRFARRSVGISFKLLCFFFFFFVFFSRTVGDYFAARRHMYTPLTKT